MLETIAAAKQSSDSKQSELETGSSGSDDDNKNELDYVINEWKGKQFSDTLLIIASYYNNPEIVKILLSYKSDVNARDSMGRTALYWACRNDSLLIVSILLDHDADPNLYNTDDNTTTLWFAGFNGNIAIMRQLIKYKFDINGLVNQGKEGTGYSVFHQCCEKGFLQCLEYLVTVSSKNAIDIYLKTTNHEMNALQLACNNSCVGVVKYLVNELKFLSKAGVINDATTNGKTALWYAAMDGDLEIVQLLCEKSKHEIDINKKNDTGNTPLHMASMRNHYHIVEWFLKEQEKLDPNIKNKDGMTPLMVAVKCGNLKSCEILANHDTVKVKDIKDKVGRNVFDYCAKFGQTNNLKIILRAMLTRLKINNWTKLEESNLVTIKTIENWIKLAKKHDKTKAMGSQGGGNNKTDSKPRTFGNRGDNNKDDDKDKPVIQQKKNRKTKNDGVIHFLEDLINGCFKFNNFELLLARLDYSNNLTKSEITIKLKECEKLNEIISKLFKYCENKQILIEFSAIIIKMIENKEIINDTLMMIANVCVPNQLENALVNGVKECISGQQDDSKRNERGLSYGNNNNNDDDDYDSDDYEEDIYGNIVESVQSSLKAPKKSLRNARDIAWYKECILHSNVLTNIDLFEKIKIDSIKQELESQQLYLSKQISYLKEINEQSWNNLINYKSFNISLDGIIQQKRVISKFDSTSENMLAMNGIPVEYEQKSLFNDYLTGFDMSSEYDNNGYLINLLIAGHKMNPLFQRHCRKLFTNEVLGVDCTFKRAPVKTKARSQLKATMDYSEREWPFTNHILDILRCSVSFENPSDLVIGLNKFRTIMKQGLRQQKGCLVDIVRIKNGFDHYIKLNDSNREDLSLYRYADVKINVIIEIGNYKMIGEIQFMLDFMQTAKEIGHIFYEFERNEDLYSELNQLLNQISDSKHNVNDEMQSNNEKYLKMIIGTRDYKLLLNYTLFGRFENEMKKRLNKVNFKDMIRFCKENQWKEGSKLIGSAMHSCKNKKNWWMAGRENAYLTVDID